MKKTLRICSLLFAVCLILGACGNNSAPTTGTTVTTVPSSAPTTTPTTPENPTLDLYRDLPVLRDKFITDAPEDGDLVLALDGVANATIVYAKDHSKASIAATDLADYLLEITGAEFPVIHDGEDLPEGNLILVGPTQKTAELGIGPYTGYPEAEKVSVIRKGNCLILCGNDDAIYKGTQNAVTYFLEEAGCGWFDDDALWQIVPSKSTLAVKAVDLTFEPVIAGRSLSDIGSNMVDRWYLGGDSFAAGHGLWRWGGKGKFAAHPDWFALVNGSRDPNLVDWWQYCYTNEEWAQQVAAGVIDYFDKNPNCVSYSIASNDGWYEGWCECDVCAAAGNQSDQMLLFANRVAAIVCEKYPEKRISFLAYHATFLPPENTVKAHPNVEVRFCLETSPIDDLMADRQIHDGYNWINKLEYTQSWLGNVTEWIDKAGLQNTSIWGWFCIDDSQYKWDHAPWVQGNVANRNIAVFEQLGVETIFMDGTKDINDLRWPLYYPFARCMYFSDMTGEEILYDACQKLYGEAADEMFLFYRILADSAQECTSSSGVNWVPPGLLDVYGNNYNMIQSAVLNIRAKMSSLTAEQAQRVENQLRGWLYVELYI